jgi:hypothetical protein
MVATMTTTTTDDYDDQNTSNNDDDAYPTGAGLRAATTLETPRSLLRTDGGSHGTLL